MLSKPTAGVAGEGGKRFLDGEIEFWGKLGGHPTKPNHTV